MDQLKVWIELIDFVLFDDRDGPKLTSSIAGGKSRGARGKFVPEICAVIIDYIAHT